MVDQENHGAMERVRVLIIEQNRRTVGELHDRLVRMGYETEVALSGESGLAIIHERDMDLAVLDHRVTGYGEWELLHQLRRWAPGLPIVLINGPRRKGVSRQARQAGAVRFMREPVNMDRLITAIATVVEP
jgi:two-component system response regulator GlrR